MGQYALGQSVLRSEDPRLLRGRGRFADDRALPHMAHGYVLRSPHVHATVNGIDVAAAKAAPGVIEEFTGADWQALGWGDVPGDLPRKLRDGSTAYAPRFPALVSDRVCCVGDSVAFVVAESRVLEQDAAELIKVDQEPLAAVTDTEAAPSGEVPLVWTRLERGELGLQDDVASVPDLIGKAIGLLPTADKRVMVSPMDQLPKLRCDPRQVLQVLAHVINNAITFSPEGQTVEVGAEVNEHRNLVVRVSDSGPRMQNKVRALAFDLFEKFDPAGMDFARGIGLGLSISRKLMEVHGGSIGFDDDQRTSFTIVLTFPAHRTVV